MNDEKLNRPSTMPAEPIKDQGLAVRANVRIAKAEIEYEAAKSGLEVAAATAARTRKDYEDLRRLTAAIKHLAPFIRDEVNALERFWRQAEERKEKLTEALELANVQLKSVYLAREQLKQIGLYLPDDGMLAAQAGVCAAQPPAEG